MDLPIFDIVDENPLRIRYMPGTGDTLVVSFSGVGKVRAEAPGPEFVGNASDGGKNHVLFVSDESRCWLNTPGMAEQIVHVIEQTTLEFDIKRVVALGNSMGGSMALIISQMFRFDAVLAIVPQFSVDPKVVPDEQRWKYFRKQIKEFRFPKVDNLRPELTEYFIVHGGHFKEKPHVLRFEDQRGVGHYVLPDRGHRMAAHLKAEGQLDLLIRLGLAGARGRFRKHIFGLGGQFRSTYVANQKAASEQKTSQVA
jgi:pimeloyl-ACP methyl ester carboxylesterase